MLDGDMSHRFLEEMDSAIHLAGSRAVPAGPTWDQDGAWRAVRAAARRRTGSNDRLSPSAAQGVLEATPRWRKLGVLTGMFMDTQGLLFRRNAIDASSLLAQRDELKAAMLSLGGEIRRVHLEIGARLVRLGSLATPEQVDHLTASELRPSLAGTVAAPAEIARRVRAFVRAAAAPVPEQFIGRPPPTAPPRVVGDRLTGWAASAGTFEGPARVVHDAGDRLEPGEVLVARTTDPSWAPLFLTAGALVVEQGGPLSHASIVARELGIPAVVNIPGIVDRLSDAPRSVRVDGNTGEVVLLEPEGHP
jgi:rifampicin phosphotransferase